jgi:hypothetical protein
MGYYYSKSGKLIFTNSFIPRATPTVSAHTKITSDQIRIPQLYVECDTVPVPEPGHLVCWTGEAAMFNKSGERIESFDAADGYEFALGKVVPCSSVNSEKVAGVVVEVAATPESNSYTHKGIHTRHHIKNNGHILRLSQGVCLAWVLDANENTLPGFYTKFVNGVEKDLHVVRELGDGHFTISNVELNLSTLADDVANLTARLDALTGS